MFRARVFLVQPRKASSVAVVPRMRRHYIHLQENPKIREALERLQAALAEPHTAVRAAAAGPR